MVLGNLLIKKLVELNLCSKGLCFLTWICIYINLIFLKAVMVKIRVFAIPGLLWSVRGEITKLEGSASVTNVGDSNHTEEPKLGHFLRVCLTGGPCGGKTTLQVSMADMFENMGWHVFRSPEVATILLGGGINFGKLNTQQRKKFQLNLLCIILKIEDTYYDLARDIAAKGSDAIVICDRGAMDVSAYLPRDEWEDLCRDIGASEVELRDCRYDCVIHLVTAAEGAVKHYGNGNNAVRSEDIESARLLDKLTSGAWVGHSHLDIIDNSTDFEGKKERAMQAVFKFIGMKEMWSRDTSKRKFLVSSFDWDRTFPTAFRDFEIRYDYLISVDKTRARIRRRGSGGSYSYSVTVSRKRAGEMVETRRLLTYKEYSLLLLRRDPLRNCVIKKRRCFVWKDIYYQLDMFESPHSGLMLLEAHMQKTRDNKDVIPPFIAVEREVTEDETYSMLKLSLAKK